jgi:peptidoglycan/LPS O-acetylase OafA/YrhL
VSFVVAGLLVAVCGGLGALVAVPGVRRWQWLPLAVVIVLTGVLFVPVSCATGIAASPFNDVSDQPRPTSCETIAGVELPVMGRFASDTVGWGLALAGFCLCLGVMVVVAGRMHPRDPGDPGLH